MDSKKETETHIQFKLCLVLRMICLLCFDSVLSRIKEYCEGKDWVMVPLDYIHSRSL